MYNENPEWNFLCGKTIIAIWVRKMVKEFGKISPRHIL